MTSKFKKEVMRKASRVLTDISVDEFFESFSIKMENHSSCGWRMFYDPKNSNVYSYNCCCGGEPSSKYVAKLRIELEIYKPPRYMLYEWINISLDESDFENPEKRKKKIIGVLLSWFSSNLKLENVSTFDDYEESLKAPF